MKVDCKIFFIDWFLYKIFTGKKYRKTFFEKYFIGTNMKKSRKYFMQNK
jgi:hypothetical protein